jgi:hypothetical protein
VHVKCQQTNFFVIEKWRTEEGVVHLEVKATRNEDYTARTEEETPEQEEIEI